MWYKGSIAEATFKAKSESKLFMVFVKGKNEPSKKMADLLNGLDGDLLNRIKNYVICVEIEEDSHQCAQFSQIFPLSSVPSTHFIGPNGIRIEILTGEIEKEEFKERIKKVLKVHSSSDKNEMSKKIEKAQQLIQENRVKKAIEEEEKLKAQEKERIRTGKELAKARIRREEAQMQSIVREIEKDKREAKLKREELLAQIAADKEERKRKQELNKQLRQRISEIQPSTSLSSADETRIQLRFPDGSSVTKNFPASDPLESVKKYIIETTSYRNFRLSTTFPKREFDESNMSMSLKDLHLSPSAVLLVIVSRTKSKPTAIVSGGFVSSLWYYLFYPITSAWLLIKRLIPVGQTRTNEKKRESDEPNINAKRMRETKYLNRDGNITRLKDTNDEGDEGTYNGNSTQQL